MSLRAPLGLSRRALPAQITKYAAAQQQSMATVVPPVTQDNTGSKGPTAMVFMNMGGPSTTGEVGDFLSRLFVSYHFSCFVLDMTRLLVHRQTPT
jgi:ferrochelatase